MEDTNDMPHQASSFHMYNKKNASFSHSAAGSSSSNSAQTHYSHNYSQRQRMANEAPPAIVPNDENQRLPVYCGFEEEELLSE